VVLANSSYGLWLPVGCHFAIEYVNKMFAKI